MAERTDAGNLHISLHGPNVRVEDAIEAGTATKELLGEVARNMGFDGLEWEIGSIQFQCDGCGLKRPDRPGPDEGWTHRDGDDFCPACSVGGDQVQRMTEANERFDGPRNPIGVPRYFAGMGDATAWTGPMSKGEEPDDGRTVAASAADAGATEPQSDQGQSASPPSTVPVPKLYPSLGPDGGGSPQ